MNDKVIYFPYMNVPQSEWFSRVLLYWDEIASIIPYEFMYRPDELDEHMQELLHEGLVRQIPPGSYTYEIPNFRSAFLELIDNDPIIQSKRHLSLSPQFTYEIHLEKLSDIGVDLVHRELAYGPERYGPWFKVELRTAMLFMAYLAAVLGKLEPLQMTPITDELQVLSVFSDSPAWQGNHPPRLDRIRTSVLEEVLPVPSADLPTHELIRFKRTNHSLLIRFRRYVETFLIELAEIDDNERRSERIRYFKDNSKEQLDEIVAKMRERRWPRIVFGGISGVLAGALPVGIGLATGDPVTSLAGIPGLVAAIYTAHESIPEPERTSPLAYAALAQRTFQKKHARWWHA